MALVAVGSNMPFAGQSPIATLNAAISTLVSSQVVLVAQSRFFRTPAFPAGSGPDFVNAALHFNITVESSDFLAQLHAAERAFGRERNRRWGARTLDLDLLALDGQVLPDADTVQHWMDLPLDEQVKTAPDQLILPHPRLHERAFVLGPLMDIAPDWTHPLLNRTVAALYEDLSAQDKASLKPLT